MERVTGIEPVLQAWKAFTRHEVTRICWFLGTLPLSYMLLNFHKAGIEPATSE